MSINFEESEEQKIGGNALKNTVTRRYNAAEYFEVSAEVVQILTDSFDHYVDFRKIEVIPAYSEKETFGDCDILTTMKFTRQQIQKTFSPNEIVINGDVISFDYKELQFDLIYSPSDEFEYSLFYFS